MNFNFGEVLSRAWQIVWKYRVLWIFGILASCSRGGTSFNWNAGGSGGDGGFDGGMPNLPPEVIQFLQTVTENIVPIAAGLVALICIFWIVAIFLGTVGRIGLIRGTWQAETGGVLAFGQLFSESMPYFWRVFGLSLLVGLPFFIIIGGFIASILIFGAIAFSQGSDTSALGVLALMPFLIGCICLLVPIGFVVSLIIRQSERAIVLENAGVIPSLSRGWEIFRSNLGPIIILAIILTVIGLVVGFVIAIPVLIIVIPATIALVVGNAPNWNAMTFALACMCLYAPLAWLINGILIAYVESAWTLTYMRLTRPPEGQPVMIEANA